MRSLQDDEQITQGWFGAGAQQGTHQGFSAPQGARTGVGAASLRWKSPIDHSDVRSLLAYLRTCLRREAVHMHVLRADALDTESCVCLPAGPEPLFTGTTGFVPKDPGIDRLVRSATLRGQALRYGFPLVIMDSEDGGLALPLLTVDVRLESSDDGTRKEFGTAPALRPVGPPDVNVALLARLGITDPEDLFGLRVRLRTGTPHTGRGPAAISELTDKVRLLLARTGIERIDDIDPRRTRGLPKDPAPGAHNTAVLFLAGPDGRPENDGEPGDVEGLLADLDPTAQDGLDPARVCGTALESLLGTLSVAPEAPGGRPRPRRFLGGRGSSRETSELSGPGYGGADVGARPPVPISTTPLTQPQYRVLCAGMSEQLTVVASPPGCGEFQVVDSLVRTAISNGQRVLVCARTEAELRLVRDRAHVFPEHPLVRIGGPRHRVAEAHLLTRLLAEHTGNLPGAAQMTAEATSNWSELTKNWERVRRVWKSMDTMASGGHVLAHLAEERGRSITRGWDPDTLFTPERGGPEYWLHRAERADAGGLVGMQHRSVIRRELAITPEPNSLEQLREVARMESEWRSAVDRRTRCAPLGELITELSDALLQHRRAGAACLSSLAELRIRHGLPAIENRLETLNWYRGSGWPGLTNLLDTLPAWMCRIDQARALPPQAGLFDLVLVVGAERARVGELLPVLYRGTRAVVFGDPAHPGTTSVLEPEEERSALAASGMSAERLDDRSLRHGSGSALAAAAKAVLSPLWLTEHEGAPSRLVAAASRHCYGGRITSRTLPDPSVGPSFEWREVSGECVAAPGTSYVNREEAYRTVVVVDELDDRLPPERTIAVVAPTQPQVALLRRLLGRRHDRGRVRVGGPGVLAEVDGAVDVTVLSPMLSTGAPTDAERQVRRMGYLWSSVLTRTRQRLVVVGDRSYWSGVEGPLGDLDAEENGPHPLTLDPATVALLEKLRAVGTSVTLHRDPDGRGSDMTVRFGARRLLLLLDREPDGSALRHLMLRGERLNRSSGDPVVVVPAWRCLADPSALVEEILGAG